MITKPMHLKLMVIVEYIQIIILIAFPSLMMLSNIFTKEFISLEIASVLYSIIIIGLSWMNISNIKSMYHKSQSIESVKFASETLRDSDQIYDGGTTAQYNQSFAIKLKT